MRCISELIAQASLVWFNTGQSFTECLRYLSVEPGRIRDSEATSVPEVEIVGDDEEVEDLPMDDRFERLAEAMARNDDEAAEQIMQELGYGLLSPNWQRGSIYGTCTQILQVSPSLIIIFVVFMGLNLYLVH